MSTPIQEAIAAESDSDGLVIMPYSDEHASQSLVQELNQQVDPTPDSTSSDEEEAGVGGPIRRSNEFRSRLGSTLLESVALSGMELSKAIERRAHDLYRNKFPLVTARFARKCRECGTEYDAEDVDECQVCGSGDLRDPDLQQRTEARQFFREVNKEGQSLQELYQALAKDAGRLGGWVHLVRYNYGVLNGEVLQEPEELVRADPKRVKPVVDENGRLGGYWWACPIHRDDHDREPGRCSNCGAEKREVFFAETEDVQTDSVRSVYFEDEVIDYAAFNERLSGHDWVSPVEHLWKRQAILEWMNSYAAAFFDDKNTDRFPGRLLILHTSNRDAVEKQLAEAQDEREQDPYANGVLYNEIPRDGNGSGDDAQVIDLMNDELMGQAPDLKDDFKSDIRSVYGQVDVQDSELEDAGGLNNEGLQLTVRDDYLASEHQSLRDGPLQKLMRVLGYDDYEIRFVPLNEPDEPPAPSDVVNAAATAEQAGISYAIEDGQFRVADTDGVVDPEPDPQPQDGPPGDQPTAFADTDTPDIDIGLARESIRSTLESMDPDDAVTGSRWIAQAYDSMFDGGDTEVEQQARTPVFRDQGDVPEFAQELLGDAIEGGAVAKPDALSNAEHRRLESILERNLVEEGRWSISSIQSDIESAFDVESETARVWAINGVQNVVQPAIQLGYMVEGDLEDRRFYLGGPENADTCPACEQLRDETNPNAGGDPVTMDEFNDRAREVAEGHDIDPEFVTGGAIHPNCVHRLSEHRDARE